MHMIGHEHLSMNLALVIDRSGRQIIQVAPIIRIGKRTGPAVVAAMNDVLWNSRQNKPWFSWHGIPPCTQH